MLAEIHIQNYAVITDLSVEFAAGLNLLSGETGSGKSIIVDALGLALGGRASPEVIRTGSERATVTAVFRYEGKPPWAAWAEETGLAGANEPELILRREIHSGGRTRLLANDQPITLAAIKPLTRALVEVHGQGEHVALFSRDAQLALLDQFAGADDSLKDVAAFYARRRGLEQEVEKLSMDEQERLRRIDLMSFELQELDRAALAPGEDAKLEGEKRLLVNLEKIRAAASLAYGRLYEDEGSACARLATVSRAVEDLSRWDASFENRLPGLTEAKTSLEDLALFLRDYLERLDAEPHRLDAIESRLALLDRLKRKYGGTIEAAIEYRERTRRGLEDIERADERREESSKALEAARGDYARAAGELSVRRREAARRFEKLVVAEVRQLGMEKSRFEVAFAAAERPGGAEDVPSGGGPRGADEIEFMISPNPGEDLRPLEKIASGGELSRFMLALKTVAGGAASPRGRAGARPLPATFVFDEVDAGIGGSVADAVGSRLQKLARTTQVLCVTHLAQIACFADRHFYVEKSERAGRTVTEIKPLEKESDRVKELARMLSGARLTDAVLQHAAAMLKHASRSARGEGTK